MRRKCSNRGYRSAEDTVETSSMAPMAGEPGARARTIGAGRRQRPGEGPAQARRRRIVPAARHALGHGGPLERPARGDDRGDEPRDLGRAAIARGMDTRADRAWSRYVGPGIDENALLFATAVPDRSDTSRSADGSRTRNSSRSETGVPTVVSRASRSIRRICSSPSMAWPFMRRMTSCSRRPALPAYNGSW